MDALKDFAFKTGITVVFPEAEHYSEVGKAVKFAAVHDIPICVRAGGGDLYGRSIVGDALVIDVRALKDVEINPDGKTAKVGGGLLIGEIATALAEHGYQTSLDIIEWVGYTGWATTGGFGPWAPKYGLGVDNIVGATIVNAQGDVEIADEDVLKAIRGTTGNFGVIVDLTIKIHALDKTLAGSIIYDSTDYWSSFEKFLAGIEELERAGDFPPELDLQPVCAQSPMGKIFGCVFTWMSSEHDRGHRYLEKVTSWAPALLNQVKSCTAPEFLQETVGLVPRQAMADTRTLPVQHLSPQALDTMRKYLDILPDDLGADFTWHRHRACSPSVEGPMAKPSVFKLRQPHYVVEILGLAVDPMNYDEVSKWSADSYSELLQSCEGNLLSSTWVPLTADIKLPSLEILFGHEDAEFLRRLKRSKDPENMFKHPIPRIKV